MEHLNNKYYLGFEGEPEIIFTVVKQDNEKSGLSLWSGYFDNIMQQITPVEGKWTALSYYYNLNIGWYDESPWLIENIEGAYEQFKGIDKNKLDELELEILEKILELLKKSIEENNNVYISYE
ncbi:hypothetical protein [Lacrimispora aerotolerans]|uniref:hypothetical protein n=1 Tax=Lacrimispora aerotolerans TaxID=36832 RepID=UPI00047A90AD|nr:hypothetical protein [Lacrimispora aerotolerans]